MMRAASSGRAGSGAAASVANGVARTEQLERRTFLSGYTVAAVAPLPALSTSFVNTQPAALVRDSAGNLYGTDPQGGASTYGSVFEANPSTGVLTILHTFDGSTGNPGVGPNQLAIDSAGNLFGFTQASTATGSGSTEVASGSAILFEIPASDRTSMSTLYTFNNPAIGEFPSALLTDPSGNVDVLTTYDGPSNAGGSILQFAPATGYGTPTVLGTMNTGNSAYPDALVRASDGSFYGTTGNGGDAAGDGTLFHLPAGSTTVATVAQFDKATTGATPSGELYVDASGNVFGDTQSGSGTGNFYGDVWEYSPATSTLSTVAGFTDSTAGGIYPNGGVVGDGGGNLIGVTSQSQGGGGTGGVFSASSTTHTITELAAFTSATTGFSSVAGVTADGSGDYFGVTSAGGANGRGAVFEVSPGTGTTGGGGTTTGTGASGSSTLTGTVTRSTVPTSVIAGTAAKGAVAVTVSNTTAAVLKGTAKVALYASTDGSIDSTSTLIASVARGVKLKASKAASISVPVKKLSLPAGNYTLLAQVTDPSGDTSVATGSTLTVAAAVVSLSGSIGPVTPSATTPGKAIAFTLTLANSGNVNPVGAAQLAVYLSTNGTDLTLPVSTTTKRLTVKPGGKAVAVRLKVKVPADASGTFYPLVGVTQGSATATIAGTTPLSVT